MPASSRIPVRVLPEGPVLASIAAAFAVLTLLFTYPIWTSPDSTLTGMGDELHQTWVMAWDAHALRSDPGALFDTNTFYPRKNTLALSENLLATAVLVAPINWAGHPILAYNVALLMSFFLSGIGMALWVRYLTASTAAGLFAGVLWAFGPAKFGQLAHLQMLSGQWVPFAFLAVAHYLETVKLRYAVGAALLYCVQFLASLSHGLMLLPCMVLYALSGLGMRSRRAGSLPATRLLRDLLIAGALMAVILLPLMAPYMQVRSAEGFAHDVEILAALSARPTSFISPSGFNRAGYMQPLSQAYTTAEGNLFPGVVVYLLLLVGTLWLLPKAWRGDWPGSDDVTATSAPSTAVGPRTDGARRFLQIACWTTAGFAGLHVASVLLAAWAGRPLATEWVLQAARSSHPALMVAPSATVALALWRWATPHAVRPARTFVTLAYLALIAYVLAYGPTVHAGQTDLGRGPYWVLYQTLPAYDAMRSIARFGIYWNLFVAAYCGFVLQAALVRLASVRRWSLRRPSLPAVATALLIGVVVVEFRVAPLPSVPVDPAANPADHWLATQPADTTVLHVPVMPLGGPGNQGVYLIGSTLHWARMVNGYASFLPPEFTRLANTRDHSDFYQLLRGYYPLLDYVLAHGDKMTPEEFADLESWMLNDRVNVDLVTRFGDILVFRPKLDWDRGVDILRRFPPAELAGMEVRLQARVPAVASGRTASLVVRWGNRRTQREALSTEWVDITVPVPPALETERDDTAHIRLQSAYELTPEANARAVGSTGREIRADVLLDVQADATRLAINDIWEAIGSGNGWQLYEIADSAGVLKQTWPSGVGLAPDALRRLIAELDPGAVVALGLTRSRARRLASGEIRALAAVGALAPDGPLRTLAVVGVAGAVPGSAPVTSRGLRSVVRIGDDTPRPEIEVRRLRLSPIGTLPE